MPLGMKASVNIGPEMNSITQNFVREETAQVVRPNGRKIPTLIDQTAHFYMVKHGTVGLRVMVASTPVGNPRGSMIICPGRTEFIEKYFETAEDLLKRGFNVMIHDPRGQGLSDRLLPDPLKSYIRDFQDYADDIAYITRHFDNLLPKPHIMLGHSMGGCVALQSVLSGMMNPSAIVCTAPMLGLFDVESGVLEWTIRAVSRMGLSKSALPFQKQKHGIPVDFEQNKLTSDEDRFNRWSEYMISTPALRVAGPTYGWLCSAFKSMSYVNRNASLLNIPGLIVAAGGDSIVDPASNHYFAKTAGIDYMVIPGSRHEVLMEKDVYREQFFRSFDEFLDRNAL